MTIAAKLAEVVTGAKAQNVQIVGETAHHWVVEYTIAGVKGTAEVIKRDSRGSV